MLTFQNNYVFEKPTYTFGTRWPFCSINLFNLKFNAIKFLFDPYLLSLIKVINHILSKSPVMGHFLFVTVKKSVNPFPFPWHSYSHAKPTNRDRAFLLVASSKAGTKLRKCNSFVHPSSSVTNCSNLTLYPFL